MKSNWENAKEAIRSSPEDSSIYIGADSIRSRDHGGKFKAKYCVVLIVHKSSRSGGQIFHKSYVQEDYGNLKQRLLNEVQYAIDAALEFQDVIGNRPMELHLDINKNAKHKSNVAMKEAIAYVRGMLGKEPVLKPYAFAATHCADHMVRDNT